MGRLLSYRRGQPDVLISTEDTSAHKRRSLAAGECGQRRMGTSHSRPRNHRRLNILTDTDMAEPAAPMASAVVLGVSRILAITS
jgi:hypothetical protein